MIFLIANNELEENSFKCAWSQNFSNELNIPPTY